MQLNLTQEEAAELRELLTVALLELRSEIRHTDSGEFRDRLHDRQRVLRQLQERLAGGLVPIGA